MLLFVDMIQNPDIFIVLIEKDDLIYYNIMHDAATILCTQYEEGL